MTTPPLQTTKYWQRRALKAEANLASIHDIRKHESSMEIQMARNLAACKVALKEAKDAIDWALGECEE